MPLQYICGATFRYAGKDHEASFNAVRDQLLLFCWNQTEEAKPVDRPSRDWFVDCPANGLARLCLESNSRISGLERVRTLANEYLAKHAAELSESRATPSESERLLSGFASDLEARLDSAQAELENSLPDLQTNDPITQRQELMNTWRERRERFATVRRDLGGAYAELDRLRTEPEPTHGVVPTESRHKALEADLALQQDLRELEVNLSELKHHLLNVWDRSTPPLNQLLTAARSLSEESPPDRNSDGPGGRSVSAMYDSAGLFYQALLAFAEKWEHERESLKGMAIDPTSGELIDLQQRARNDLNDFLYEAGKHLTAMRQAVQAIEDGSDDSAQHHVFRSQVARGFRIVQSAHHRFEFAAGGIDTRDNFQLDTAMRSARGLRRRTQQRIRLIDERLQEAAAEQARAQHREDLARAEDNVGRLRIVADEAVGGLVDLQDRLNLSADLTEEYLRASLPAELVKGRIELTQSDLARTQDQLAGLAAKRAAAIDGLRVELVECAVVAGPLNRGTRFGVGAFGTVAAFAGLSMARGRLTRRRTKTG